MDYSSYADQDQENNNQHPNTQVTNEQQNDCLNDKIMTIQNFISYGLSDKLTEIKYLTLKIVESLEENQLESISTYLSRLSQLKKLTIQTYLDEPESIINSISLGIVKLIYLTDLSFEFYSNQACYCYYSHNFNKHLSDCISLLIGLQKLTLMFSEFQSHENAKQLLDSIGSLVNLKYLKIDLVIRLVTNENKEEMFTEIFKLKQLKQLYLTLQPGTEIFKDINYFSNSLSNLENLTHLSIKFPQYFINSSDLNILFSQISTLRNLVYLEIEIEIHSYFFEKREAILQNQLISAEPLRQLSKLQCIKLNIKKNNFENIEIIKLGQAVSLLKNLTMLDLKIGDFMMEYQSSLFFGKSLSNLSEMSDLQLDLDDTIPLQTKIKHQDILEGISKLTQLKAFSFHFLFQYEDRISKEIDSIFSCIGFLVNLETLILQITGLDINDSSFAIFASSVSKLQQLSTLDLELTNFSFRSYGNEQVVSVTSKLPQSLRELHIRVYSNKKSRKEIEYFSNGISNLTNLIFLELVFNSIQMCTDQFQGIVKEIRNLPRLCILKTNQIIKKSQKQWLLRKSRNLVVIR